MKRTIQINTILFALIMLAAYVVYSQRQQTRTVAPSSKFMVLPEGKHGIPAATNRVIDVSSNYDSTLVFPGSKSAAIFTPHSEAPIVLVTNVPARPPAFKVAPSSKSGRVFDPESTSTASRTALSSSNRPSSQPSAAVTSRTATEKRSSRTNSPATSTTQARP